MAQEGRLRLLVASCCWLSVAEQEAVRVAQEGRRQAAAAMHLGAASSGGRAPVHRQRQRFQRRRQKQLPSLQVLARKHATRAGGASSPHDDAGLRKGGGGGGVAATGH